MRVVCIGNGPATISAVKTIKNYQSNIEIIIISKESYPAYTPCFLSKYVSGEISEESLYIVDKKFYERNSIKIKFGIEAISIDISKKEVFLSNKEKIRYDRLLIAAGASCVIPSIANIEGEDIYTFKNLTDANNIIKKININKEVIVMGGGFIGMEIAEALFKRCCKVTILEKENRILPKMLDKESSDLLKKFIQQKGLKILNNINIVKIIRDSQGKLKGVEVNNSDIIPCDALVISTGIKPNIQLVKNTSIKTEKGIIVDSQMRTNVPDIYAAGDIAEINIKGRRKLAPIHINAIISGNIAGANIAGIEEKRLYSHIPDMNVITLFGMPIVSIGTYNSEEVLKIKKDNALKKIYLEKGKIKGIQFLGDITKAGLYLWMIQKDSFIFNKNFLNNKELLFFSFPFLYYFNQFFSYLNCI